VSVGLIFDSGGKLVSLRFRLCPPASRGQPRLWSWPKPRIFCCRDAGPRGSEAVRMVPMRGFSGGGGGAGSCEPGPARGSRLAPVRSKSSFGGRPVRRDDDRWCKDPLLVDLSSGGGVGGKTLRFSGGSECCRVRLLKFLWTKFVAAKEMPSRSSSAALSMTIGLHWCSTP
jgi:hypothetical protein